MSLRTMNIFALSVGAMPVLLGETLAACPSSSEFDVLVIGAGMAGLAAGRTLQDAGISSFAVLEARANVGGRMRTKEDFGESVGDYKGVVEEGANWITGGLGNRRGQQPIKKLADQFGTEYYSMSYDDMDAYDTTKPNHPAVKFRDLKQKQIAFQQATACVDKVSSGLYEDFFADGISPADLILRDVFRDQCDWDPQEDPIENALEHFTIDSFYLNPPEQLGLFNFAEDTFFDFGTSENFVMDQYGGLTSLAQQYSAAITGRIFKEVEVTRIDYSGSPVTVSTNVCGDLKAQVIVFTPSLGVLKKMEESGDIIPSLDYATIPPPLEMGTWIKIFYQFDINEEPFWDTSKQWILAGREIEKRGQCSMWLNLDFEGPGRSAKAFPGSRILVCLIDQLSADAFGEAPDYVIGTDPNDAEKLLEPLKIAFSSRLPFPMYTTHITEWLNDPYTYGSWENWIYDPDLNYNDYKNFFDVRENRFIISGSGSCGRYWGFMHGAYYGGIKSAKWAINCLNGGNCEEPYSPCDDPGNIQNDEYEGGRRLRARSLV